MNSEIIEKYELNEIRSIVANDEYSGGLTKYSFKAFSRYLEPIKTNMLVTLYISSSTSMTFSLKEI